MAIRSLFQTWEETFSRFLPEGELSVVNRRAGSPIFVSSLFFGVLTSALAKAEAMDGLFDPTLLGQMTTLGYDRSFEQLSDLAPAAPIVSVPGGGWRAIKVDHTLRRVTIPVGVGLDLGGIVKGLVVDAALANLRDLGIPYALVNAGGDLAVLGSPPGAESWSIAVPGLDRSWAIPLQTGALATSGRGRRHWTQGDQERHHLLDPRTGLPATTSLLSVTAVGPTCAQAEIAAKVAFVLGPEAGGQYLAEQQLAGLLVDGTGSWRAAGSWPTAAMQYELN